MQREGALVLDDGTIVRGRAFGGEGTVFGELVFNTSMTGYQEALTDPSYNGQLLMMTYPLIGNYGVSETAFESDGVKAEGFVVREHCPAPEHRESRRTLDDFLRESGVIGVSGVDTRALTIKSRARGTMRAAITTESGGEELLDKVSSMPYPDARNLVAEVSAPHPLLYPFRRREVGGGTPAAPGGPPAVAGLQPIPLSEEDAGSWGGRGGAPRVVVVDCGVKASIVRCLSAFAEVVQVPYSWTAARILALAPAGVLVSNGPGDPAHPEIQRTVVRSVRELAGRVPVMGICLGHQILALAFGGRTFKLKFGHRGTNQPVREVGTHRVRITSQNHGFAVHPELPPELELLETNVNDGTVEALRHRELPVFSVQYHPEASPGPRDSRPIFERFRRLICGEADH
ncbi:MAG: glutamine-hydrolyzing carbamoyl-phosphate synthase small subunit [Thermoplasmatota archaeon]